MIAPVTTLVAALAVSPAPQLARVEAGPRYADLRVDVDVYGDGDAALQQRIQERGEVLLRRAAVLPARSAMDPALSVAVQTVASDSTSYTFEVRLAHANAEPPTAQSCWNCTEGELVAAIEQRLGELVATIEPPVAPPRVRSMPAAAPLDVPTRRRSLGRKGIAGASLLGVGLAVGATGLGLALRPDRPTDDPRYEVTTRPAGFALIGVGLAGAVVGAILLAVDRHPRSRRVAMLPMRIVGTF